MNKKYEAKYHSLEEFNWWFIARREIIFNLLMKMHLKDDSAILDIGCSGGPMIECLENKGFTNVFGIDISEVAIDLCRKKGIMNASLMTGEKTDFKNSEFDVLIASDILEHIRDESGALSEWFRILKPNGKLIIFVPAFQFLWSAHDSMNHHYRRYTLSQLSDGAVQAGFRIDRSSYWNFNLFFLAAFIKCFKFIYPEKKDWPDSDKLNKYFNKFLIRLLRFENRLLRYFNFFLGMSVFIVVTKRKKFL